MRLHLILLIVLVASRLVQGANAPASEPAADESLGSQLLNDLPTLSPNPPSASSKKAATQQQPPQPSAPIPTAQFDDLGEDIGQPSGPLPLVRARQGMQRASSLLAASTKVSNSGAVQQAGAVQKQVVAQLDELIAQLSKQCQGGQCQQPGQSQQPSQRSQPKPSQSGKGAGGRGKSPARDSSDPLNRASAQPADKGDIDSLVKDLWGHLPQRSREQMLQSFSTEFLPKYELEIEQYYRRLSEEQSANTRE